MYSARRFCSLLDMVGVVGSNPIVPTNSKRVAEAALFFGLLVRGMAF